MRRRRKRSRVLRSEVNDATTSDRDSPAPAAAGEKNVHTETDKKSLAIGCVAPPSREDDESTVEGYDTENYRQFQSADLMDLSNENDFASTFKQTPHSPGVEASIETQVQNDEMEDGSNEKKEERKEVKVRKRGRPPKMKIRDALALEHPAVVGVPTGRHAAVLPKENLHKKQQCLSSTSSSSVLPSNLVVVEPTSSMISFSDIVAWNSNANDSAELHIQIDNNDRNHHHHLLSTYQTDTAGGNSSPNHSSLQSHRHDNFSALATKQMGAGGGSTPASKNDKENKRNDDNSGNVIAVVCGSNHGLMHLSRLSLATGERCKTKCIQFNDRWWTPSEFQMTSGRGAAKDWKRTIRHGDKCLKALLESGTLKLNLCNKNACFCDACNTTSYHSLVNLSKLPSQNSGTTSDLTSEEVFNKSPPRNASRPAVGEVVSREDGRKDGRKRSKDPGGRDRSPMQKKMRVSDGRRNDQKALDLVYRRSDTSGDSHVTDFLHAQIGMKSSSDEEKRRSGEALLRHSMFQVPLSPVEFFRQQQQLMQSHLDKSSDHRPSDFYAEAFSSLAGFNSQPFMGHSLHHPGFGSPNLSGLDFQRTPQMMEKKSFFHAPASVYRQDSTNSFPSLSQAESPSAPIPAESRTHLRAVIEELKLKKKKSLSHASTSSLTDQTSNEQKSSASPIFDHQSPLKDGPNEESNKQDSAVDLSKTLNNTNELVKLLTGSNLPSKSSLNRAISPNKSTSNGFASHGFFNPLFSPTLTNHSLNLPFSPTALPFYSPYIFMGFPLHPIIPSTSLGNLSPSAHHQNAFMSQFTGEQTISSKTTKSGFNSVNAPQNVSPENTTNKHSFSKTYFPSKCFPYSFPADVNPDCHKTSNKHNPVARSSESKEKLKEILLKTEDDDDKREEECEDKKCIARSEGAHLEGVDSSTVLDFSLKNAQISKDEKREIRDSVNNEIPDDDRDGIPDNDNGQVLDLSKK